MGARPASPPAPHRLQRLMGMMPTDPTLLAVWAEGFLTRAGYSMVGFASAPWHLYAIRVLNGAATAAREPTAMALIARHGHRDKMASAFAGYTTARNLGRAIGYAAAGLLIPLTGYFTIFLI